MTYHAKLSPSGAHRWMHCAGSVVLEADKPDNGNAYSKEGTAAHAVAAMALTEGRPASAYIGRRVDVSDHETFEVTADMAESVQVYLDNVHARVEMYKAAGAETVDLFIEQQVPIGHITGEEGATGTADVIIVAVWADGRCVVDLDDLKFGRGVAVSAERNEQLMLYALGAIELIAPLGYEPTDVALVIHQPRIQQAPSEWDCTVEELMAFADKVREAARRCAGAQERRDVMGDGGFEHSYLNPGESQCKFCKAKATCPALAKFVTDSVGADFDNVDVTDLEVSNKDDAELGIKMKAIDLIEDWCKAVRAETERRLLAGTPVPGYKLVQGRAGARAWSDTEAAEQMLKSFRLKKEQMYSYSLISPTDAEKLAPKYDKHGNLSKKQPDTAPAIKDGQWKKLKDLVTRSAPKPSVAPETDPRPALVITPVVDDFQEVVA